VTRLPDDPAAWKADPEVDYGHHWVLPTGQRARLTWNETTGVLYLHHPDPLRGDSALLVVPDRDNVEDMLAGVWEEGPQSSGDLGWLQRRLWLVGATLPDWALPASRGG
jgi:hypothetical protein